MEYDFAVIEPRDITRPDIIGLYPMPIFGTLKNTGSRLQQMVDELGFPFIATDLLQQNKKMVFGMEPKSANQPAGTMYEYHSKKRAEFFGILANRLSATVKIGMGDSLGVSVVQGMKLHAEDHTVFDAVLVRDGWNLRPPTSGLSGIGRYAIYQARDKYNEITNHRAIKIPHTPYDDFPEAPSEVKPWKILYNVADLMKGPENRDNALRLAELPRLALNVVCLDHGLSGSRRQQEQFVKELQEKRSEQAKIMLRTGIYPGWHSYLIDPLRGARDVNDTLRLLDNRPDGNGATTVTHPQ